MDPIAAAALCCGLAFLFALWGAARVLRLATRGPRDLDAIVSLLVPALICGVVALGFSGEACLVLR